MALSVALRLAWFDAPLGNDEGGLAYVATHWHGGGPELYGHNFVDRPPLLLAAFRAAVEAGGPAAIRALGAIAAASLVFLVALLGRELGGRRAGIWAAGLAAVFGSSVLLGSVYTPAELLAVLPSAASILLLLIAHRARGRRHALLFFAGLLAAAALLVKQSFGDALVAGIVFLTVSAYLAKGNRREWVGLGAAYVAALAVVALGLELWEAIASVPDGATSYALFGFRLDGLGALADSARVLPRRILHHLVWPLLVSGLALVFVWSAAALARLRDRPAVLLTIAAWFLAGIAGVLLGGIYWSHYLIELIPVASVTAALALSSSWRALSGLTAAALLVTAIALAGGLISPPARARVQPDPDAEHVGRFIAWRAHPADTIYVRYAQPNITYYSGLRNPYPYGWSLMLRTIPDAQHKLRSLLASPRRRPTWIAAWEPSTAYRLDRSGRTAGLIRRNYRPVERVAGTRVLLARGLARPGPASEALARSSR